MKQLSIFNDKLEVNYVAIHNKYHYDKWGNLICRDYYHTSKMKAF